MDTQTLEKLISLLKEMSPALLNAGQQKLNAVIVNDITGILFCATLLAVCVWAAKATYKWYKAEDSEEERLYIGIIVGVVCAMLALVSFAMVVTDIGELINYAMAPDYYTIKAIISLVK